MASYNELNALIDAYINRNGVQAITGQILNGVLKAMVEQLGRGYTIMGAATPTTDPGTPDGPECYFASETGTYTDFDGLQVAPGELALLCYTPTDGWTKETLYEGFQQVTAQADDNIGVPSVGVSYANGVLNFRFRNIKGEPGENGQDGLDGDPAGFGTIGADITGGVGTPGVSVESSGPATAKNLQFHFTNLKGETGVTSVVATVDNTTGTPTCTVSLVGQQLTLAFSGLKGAQGDTGSSVDYPFTIVNNLTTNDATQALSAAQGVVLDGKVSQLEAEVNENNTILSPVDLSVLTESKGIINSSGKWQNTSGYCVFVPLTPGKPYKVVARDTGSDIGVLAEAGMGANGANVVFATGYSSRIVMQPSSTLEFVAPVDAVSLYVRTKNSQGTNVTPTVFAPSGTVKQKVESLDEDVTELQDISKALTGYTLQGQGDTWSSTQLSLAPGVKYTVFLADKNVSMTGVTSTYARFAIDAYNSSNVRIERLVVINVGTALDDSYLITIPDECSYLLIGCRCKNGVDFGFAISVGDSRGSKNSDDLLVGTFNSSFNETDTEATRVAYSSLIDGKNTIETFLLFSDPHLTPRSRYETMTEIIRDKYISALQKFYNSLPEDMCICLGDWLNFYHSNTDACAWLGYCDAYMRKLFKNYYPLLGNHDMNPYNPDSGSSSWLNSLYYKTCENLMFRQNGGTYYSFDGRNTKFYALNTGISPIKTMTNTTMARLVNNRWEQVAWLGQKLLTDDAEHSVILMHIYSNASNEEDWFSDEEGMGAKGIHALGANVKTLVTAYNKRESVTLNGETYNFSSCTGKVLMMMCGHTHFDYVDTSGEVPIVCITNLEGGVLNNGTISYALIPTFDNCLVDYDSDKLYMVRVGAGASRIVNYFPKSVASSSTLSLTTELTGTITWATRDGSIATVSEGVVTGVSSGYVGILATDENGKQEVWTVKVS